MGSQAQVAELMPRRVKKRRKVEAEDGSDQGWEEYFDYIFPEDEAAKPNLKLLAMAKMWKKNKDIVTTENNTDSNTEGNSNDGEDDNSNKPDEEGTAGYKDGENPDANDPEIANESSSDSDSEEDESSMKKRKVE